ncbi:MAG: hypothetical protein HKP55_02515 [Gammaproteobacteria bacterium]|nr:hypothetical protein [Gammaproteobacteria bacterium]
MTLLELYNTCRKRFPELVHKVDEEHKRLWGSVGEEFAYSWFETLAHTLNHALNHGVDHVELPIIKKNIEETYLTGDEEVKNCIDVGFTESLFWQVPPTKAARYWLLLPNTLKDLYIDFHDTKPA